MDMYFVGVFNVLKGTEVEAPRIIPPNHTPLLLLDLGPVKKYKPTYHHAHGDVNMSYVHI